MKNQVDAPHSLMRAGTGNLLAVCFAIGLLSFPALSQNTEVTPSRNQLAIVAGEAIYEDQLPSSVQGQIRQIQQQEYEAKRKALDELVSQKLLEIEAKKKGVDPEQLLELEVDGKLIEPTAGEVETYYLARKDQFEQPFDEIKMTLLEELKHAKVQEGREKYLKGLREQTPVAVLLGSPKVTVTYDLSRIRGSASAPVMIVEFSDFSCPFCRQEQYTLNELLTKYKGKVSLAYRDFPLRDIHPQAQLAAEAARCAGAQGKFWEYHDLLFSNPDKLDRTGLLEHSHTLGLDQKQFETCLTSGRYRPHIEQDIQDGTRDGVSGTPGFFINGIFLGGAQPAAAFEKIIDEELLGVNHTRFSSQ